MIWFIHKNSISVGTWNILRAADDIELIVVVSSLMLLVILELLLLLLSIVRMEQKLLCARKADYKLGNNAQIGRWFVQMCVPFEL